MLNISKKASIIEKIIQKVQVSQSSKKQIKEPSFFCDLCNRKLQFNELIDGNKCLYCDSGLFLKIIDKQ